MRQKVLTVYHSPFTMRLPFTVYQEGPSRESKRITENILKTENGERKTISGESI